MHKALLVLTATSTVAAFAATGALAGALRLEAMDTSMISSDTKAADPAHSLVGWRLDTENLRNSSIDITVPISSVTVAGKGRREHMVRAMMPWIGKNQLVDKSKN